MTKMRAASISIFKNEALPYGLRNKRDIMVGRFFGRDIIDRPTCPFCGQLIDRPKELETRMPHEMPMGTCSCGAVYAYDVTGHNLGTAMVDALVFGCNMDWDLAWGLLPEEDYQEIMVEHYDLDSHLIVHGGVYEGRRISGTLYFIRLHEDVREVTEEGVQQRMERATPPAKRSSGGKRGKKSFSKKEVEALVREYRVHAALELAEKDKRIVRDLQRLLYSVDNLMRWRAADVMGRVSAMVAKEDPGTISRLLQSLYTSLVDTAASSWGSLDAIGEIVSNSPERFAGYLPQLYQLTRDRALLAGILRALGIIGASRPDLIRKNTYQFIPLLADTDPEVRGYTAILLGNLKAHEAREDLEGLVQDSHEMEVYEDGALKRRTVGDLASRALSRI
jgi:HEAT-like repeat protein